jgi:replicative DNA helicase
MLQIAAQARRLKSRHGLALVCVDYLQLVEAEDRRANRTEQVGAVSRRLKCLAKELRCPVLAMAQLSRAAESDTDRRPRLSDLRESGSIEQDADTVFFLHRTPTPGKVLAIIAKQRQGPLAEVPLTFEARYTRFANYADPPFERN